MKRAGCCFLVEHTFILKGVNILKVTPVHASSMPMQGPFQGLPAGEFY